MRLLLLSLGTGAVPGFLAATAGRPAGAVRIGYLDDAALPYGDAPFVAAERARIAGIAGAVVDLRAGDADAGSFAAALDGVDALYVAGGNTFALMAALRRRGCDAVLTERVRAGLPYIGCSAGSVIAGPSLEPVTLMDDPAEAPDLADHTGLGLVGTVVIPHADGKLPPYPRELIDRIEATHGATHPLTFLADDRALLVEDGTVREIPSP